MFPKTSVLSIIAAILVACVAPSPLIAQDKNVNFFVQHMPPKEGQTLGEIRVWTASCSPAPKTGAKLSCTLEHNACEACPFSDPKKCDSKKYCPFLVNATHLDPITLWIGQARYNPTCVYGAYYDWTQRKTIYIYGPC